MTRVLGLIGAVIVIAAVGYFGWFRADAGTTQLIPVAGTNAAEVDTSGVVEMSLGAADAPVTIVEYASFTCPHCRAFHEGPFKQLKADYIDTGKVKLVYREVYFDRPGIWASMMARCGGPEKFFGIAELIYKGQDAIRVNDPAVVADEVRKIGRLAGIDNDTLEACLQDKEKAETLVAWFQKNAEADQITGTPSFVVNGKLVKNMPYDEFKAVIDAELAK